MSSINKRLQDLEDKVEHIISEKENQKYLLDP